MTSDLPFDSGDTDADDRAGDTAYRVATGVARVARAGAYVTGGALVAANGGGVPAPPGSQRLDSWHTGWARNSDPEPDAPSPVVTFPEPDSSSAPQPPVRDVSGHGFHPPAANPPAPTWNKAPMIPNGHDGAPGPYSSNFPNFRDEHRSGVPDWRAPHSDSSEGHTPSYPGPNTHSPQIPDWRDFIDQPGNHGLGLPGHGFGMPDGTGFVAPGSNIFGLPRVPAAANASDTAQSANTNDTAQSDDADGSVSNHPLDGIGSHAFDGHVFGNHAVDATSFAGLAFDGNAFGDHAYDGHGFNGAGSNPFDGVGHGDFGVFLGAQAYADIHTDFRVDVGVGPNGAYVDTDLRVEASAGAKVVTAAGTNVGDQVDRFSHWLDSSSPGAHTPSARSTMDHHGTPANSGLGATPQTIGVTQPTMPTAVALPIAPVAPVAPPPASTMTVAQPVAATPLQTIIQPDAATTPIANVLVASGPSPLTAPAAAVPALFDHPNPLQPVVDTVTTTTPVYTGTPSTANIPTTITKTVPTPGTVVTPDPTIPKTPDSGITKTPGVGITPTPGSGTGSEPTATKLPTATDTHTPGTTAVPTHSGSTPTPDDDVTTPNTGGAGGTTPSTGGPGSTPSTGAGAGTTGHTAPSTQPQPSADIPTVDVPTQQPTQPTVSHNEPAPTLAPITPTMDVEVPSAQVPVPTAQPPVAPMKPPTGSDPRPHAIAGDLGSPSGFFDHHDPSMFVPVDDHSALTIMVAGGLATPLLPDTTMAETHHLMPCGLDIVLM